MSEFQKWWDETYGQILTITNDPDADASCRIAKIAAMDAFKAGAAALEAERDALRADAARYRWARKPENASAVYHMIARGECGANMDARIDDARAQS